VLVIGATGILAPAAEALRERGARVIGVSRAGGFADGDDVAVDARDAAAMSAALQERTWTDAVAYGPAVSDASLAWVRRATPGRCVEVRTSAAADPALGILIVPTDTLQLGWHAGESGNGWHDPEEVSAAALEVLADGRGRILGAVRPWSDRP
jgi:hypothetical protein